MKEACGTDLTVDDPINYFHHSGPCNLAGGDWQVKQPHKYLWAVLHG